MSMKRIFQIALVVAIASASGFAAAQSSDRYYDDQSVGDNDSYVINGGDSYRDDDRYDDRYRSDDRYDYRSDGSYRYRNDRRYAYQDCRRHDSAAPIVGAIIGGAIGNSFGHGRDRDLATIAGAGLGYAAGDAADDRRCYDSNYGGYYDDRYGYDDGPGYYDYGSSYYAPTYYPNYPRSSVSISIGGYYGGLHHHYSNWDRHHYYHH
jgi:hypothetical protein